MEDDGANRIMVVLQASCAEAGVEVVPTVAGHWVSLRTGTTPRQGWKLHVTAWPTNALDVLARCAPLLLARGTSFKATASLAGLAELNQGTWGESQIGKFITVYPVDADDAVALARLLDEATRGLAGPLVPSDRALRPGSLVSYRYGGMGETTMVQTAIGMTVPAILDADGSLRPDIRSAVYVAPDGISDPFEAAGVFEPEAEQERTVANRYAPVATLYRSPRSIVQLGVDLTGLRRCVLKRAHTNGAPASDGASPRTRLLREAALLERLAGAEVTAELYDCVLLDDETILVTEDLGARTLETHARAKAGFGSALAVDEMVALASDLALRIARVHASGVAHRDIKTANVMVTDDGTTRLLDLENGTDLSTIARMGGTVGYVPPEMATSGASGVAHDIYSYGAVLYFLATSAEPSVAPKTTDLLSRPPRLLNRALPPAVEAIIRGCVHPDQTQRFTSMDDVVSAWESVRSPRPAIVATASAPPSVLPDGSRASERARAVLDELCATAVPVGSHHVWVDAQEGSGAPTRDLGTGVAGHLLALVELADEFGFPEPCEPIVDGAAAWLMAQPRPLGAPPVGLYMGDSGVGATLLRVGQLTGRDDLLEAACRIGEFVAAHPTASPDVFNGMAGALRFELMLFEAIGERGALERAIAMGDRLLDTAERTSNGCCWRIPAGYDTMSGQVYVGYAHGAAGIADVLLDLYEVTGLERFAQAANDTLDWVESHAKPVLDGGRGLGWPVRPDEVVHAPVWCHGATGIGQSFLTAARLGVRPGALEIATRAAAAVIAQGRVVGGVQCHGLAGQIELLLDLHQHTSDPRWLSESFELHALLEAHVADHDGAWQGDQPGRPGSAYMTGGAGIAMCLLRLADPDHRPRQLSRSGFSYRSRSLVATHTSGAIPHARSVEPAH